MGEGWEGGRGAHLACEAFTRAYYGDEIIGDQDESDEYVEKNTPILPPMAPSRPDMDAATKALGAMPVQTDEEESIAESESTVSASADPWADVDHSEEE